jgi:dihydroxyacetone kinase-like protein
VAVLINSAGATPMGELLIVFRSVHRLLPKPASGFSAPIVGNYAASLDMAGCSVV